ncbi:hypothetical protein l11_15590 [Neisseria weaveri LMG 5135]|nr:hypothetical protein l11_15590 [Neisseria weaveri LMG 5135]
MLFLSDASGFSRYLLRNRRNAGMGNVKIRYNRYPFLSFVFENRL